MALARRVPATIRTSLGTAPSRLRYRQIGFVLDAAAGPLFLALTTNMKAAPLLITSAALEAGIGLALLFVPSIPSSLLLGATLTAPAAVTVARVAGGALLALALACWMARNSASARALIMAMLLYNVVTTCVLLYAGLALGLSGVGLWPAVVLHATMAAWCIAWGPTGDRTRLVGPRR
jgi:hypothetical protein